MSAIYNQYYSLQEVTNMTNFSASEIDCFEKYNLIHPHILPSFEKYYLPEHVAKLLEIQSLLEQGINLAGVKMIFQQCSNERILHFDGKHISESKLRHVIRQELYFMH